MNGIFRGGRQFRSNTTGEICRHLVFQVPPPSITASTQPVNVSYDWPHPPFQNVSHWGLPAYFPTRTLSRTTGPASASWNFHLSCQKAASAQIPQLLTTMTSLINYPCVQGGTERWRQQIGKWVFPLQINVHEVYSWHLISSPGWGPSGRTLAGHGFCQLPGYLGWIGNLPLIWTAQSVWEHSYV